jgi:hypothetical protein
MTAMICVGATKRTARGAAMDADEAVLESICEKLGGKFDGVGKPAPGQNLEDGFNVEFFIFVPRSAIPEAVALMEGAGFTCDVGW